MPEDKPKRRSAIDTLVVRDHTAVFWFVVACVVGGACAWYIILMADVLKQRPPFVVMDTSGAYYVPPGILYSEMDAMHLQMTEFAAETLLERTPDGLVYADRLPKLCMEDALKQIQVELRKEDRFFTSQKAMQTATLDKPEILIRKGTAMATQITGNIFRRSVFSGKEQSETYRFTLILIWRQNLRILSNKGFPSQVEKLQRLKLEKVSDS